MPIDEADRLVLRQELERVFNNPRHAETLMRSLPQTENTEVATSGDLALLSTDLQSEMHDLRREMHDIRREMQVMGRELGAEITGVTAEMKTDMAEITRQMAVQFRLTVLMQMGVLLAVISLMATRP